MKTTAAPTLNAMAASLSSHAGMRGAAVETGGETSAAGSGKAGFGIGTTIFWTDIRGSSAERDELGDGLSPAGVWTKLPLYFKSLLPGNSSPSSGWAEERGWKRERLCVFRDGFPSSARALEFM